MARVGDPTWRTAPGPGDLTRTNDPQHDTPGRCEECEGNHPTSRCPAVARIEAARRRQTSKDAA